MTTMTTTTNITTTTTSNTMTNTTISCNTMTTGREDEKSNSNGPMLYCAPTGKAASVIKKRVGAKAFTIHQVLHHPTTPPPGLDKMEPIKPAGHGKFLF